MASYERYTFRSGETRWRVWWRDPDHRNRNKSGFKTKRDASAWAAKNITTAINDGQYIDPQGGRVRVEPLGVDWIEAHRSIWKPSYTHSVEVSWKTHVCPKWGGRRLSDIHHSEVQRWVSELGEDRSATVTIRAFGILRGIYETAINDGRIVRSPCDGVKLPPKPRPVPVYLTPAQLHSLADCSGVYGPLILVLGLCGLRWGEATALTVGDVDFVHHRLHVSKSVTKVGGGFVLGTPKSGKARDVPLFGPVAEALRPVCDGRDDGELLFTGEHGGYVQPVSIGRNHASWYTRAFELSGVTPIRAHDLRHTAASIAVHSGANVKAIQRMLGHSSAAMTLDRYADLFSEDLDVLISEVDTAVSSSFLNDGK